jgi:hypothetical protein
VSVSEVPDGKALAAERPKLPGLQRDSEIATPQRNYLINNTRLMDFGIQNKTCHSTL